MTDDDRNHDAPRAPDDVQPAASPKAAPAHSADIAALRAQLDAREQEIARLQRARAIEGALRECGVVDPETARMLIEHRLDSTGDARDAADSDRPRDIASLIEALKAEKPFLFGTSEPGAGGSEPGVSRQSGVLSGGGVSSPRVDPRHGERLDDAADEARATGRMADLLRYMRIRRRYHQRE